MSSNTNTPSTSRVSRMGFSMKELELLAAAWISCGDAVPKPDYNFMADFCGYKNGGSASVMFGHLRRKLKAIADAEGTTAQVATPTSAADKTSTAKKTTGGGRKRAAPKNTDDTPSKRTRKKTAHTSEKKSDEESEVKQEPELDADYEEDDFDSYIYPDGTYGMS